MFGGVPEGQHDLVVQNFYRTRSRIFNVKEAAVLFHFHYKGDFFALAMVDFLARLDGVIYQIGKDDNEMFVFQPEAGEVV